MRSQSIAGQVRKHRVVLFLSLLLFPIVGPVTSAEAWVTLSSGTFQLTQVGETQEIFNVPQSQPVAATVTTTTGQVVLEASSGAGWVAVGEVAIAQGIVREGTWRQLRLRALQANSLGTFEVREEGGTNGWVGGSETTLGGSPVQVYGGAAAAWRGLIVTAGSGSVAVRLTSTGSPVLTLDPGDTGAVFYESAEYWVSGAGTVGFSVDDPQGEWSDWHSVKKDDKDDAEDLIHNPQDSSTTCHDYEVKNTGQAKIVVKYKYVGGAENSTEVDPGDTFAFNCTMEWVKITFPGKTGSAQFRYRQH